MKRHYTSIGTLILIYHPKREPNNLPTPPLLQLYCPTMQTWPSPLRAVANPDSDAELESKRVQDSVPGRGMQLDPVPMATPSPIKRRRSEMAAEPTNVSTPPQSSKPSEPQSAQSYTKRQKYYYVMRALKKMKALMIYSAKMPKWLVDTCCHN